ncbi:MAG: hypothetical protein BKP49_10375 [Treponema sp. CETP13]|nr:MAG: hypothetical protein BKP49_10375 [Treponema sp. CETP13]
MKKNVSFKLLSSVLCFCLAFILGISVVGCRSDKKDSAQLTVTISNYTSIMYRTENKENLIAKYYNSSDNTENYVVLILPNDEEITLTEVISASGARYSDGAKYEWWTKGPQGILKTTPKKGAAPIYLQCVSIAK